MLNVIWNLCSVIFLESALYIHIPASPEIWAEFICQIWVPCLWFFPVQEFPSHFPSTVVTLNCVLWVSEVLATQHDILCSLPSHVNKYASGNIKFYKLFKEEIMSILHRLFHRREEERILPTHSMRPALALYQSHSKTSYKRKLQTDVFHEHTCKNSRQNFSKWSSTRYKNDNILWLSSL